MTDLVIKGTGNSRFLKGPANIATLYPTWEDALAALAAGTFPVDFNGINSAGVQTAGTPLNKSNLLSDPVAEMLEGPTTPNSAFLKIAVKINTHLPRNINGGWKLLKSYTTAGSYTWTAPDLFGGYAYNVGVLVIGGGGSGGLIRRTSSSSWGYIGASGGGSGHSMCMLSSVNPNSNYNLIVGAGGASVSKTSTSNTEANGKNGGSSSFSGTGISGGSGGTYISNASGARLQGASGGQSSFGMKGDSYFVDETRKPFGGTIIGTNVKSETLPNECWNPFTFSKILGAGGTATAYCSDNSIAVGLSGGGSAKGIISNSGQSAGNGMNGYGAGGGALLRLFSGSTSTTDTSGAGGDGGVYIYVQGNS